ncbi:MAG: carboxypeptidase regulatory-like domain-containing protein [Gemmatimonadetes bacterium]|nr:carboxypeptidase regulatory-like domain-containing protein [Gemmatimonadota bacterium]
MNVFRATLLLLVAALASCYESPGNPIVCTDEARPGIILRVFEVGTMDPVTEGLEGDLVEGDYQESLAILGSDNVLFGATERPGTYTATVRAAGYQEWQQSGIAVTADECHVITRDLSVSLVPSE